jgi:Cell division protein CrgA
VARGSRKATTGPTKGPGKGAAPVKGAVKGTAKRGSSVAGRAQAGSKRYTPPTPKTVKRSQLWVPVAMFTSMGAGVAVIVGNYLQLLPGGDAKNSYLILGLALMIAGFVLSTRYH